MAFAFAAQPVATAPVGPAGIEASVLSEMNLARARNHRAPLQSLSTLTRPARAQSRYLLKAGLLSHDSADGSSFSVRLVRAGFPAARAMGENLVQLGGCNDSTARLAVQLWMQHPAHRANLLQKQFHLAGVGVASSPNCETTIITADYGG